MTFAPVSEQWQLVEATLSMPIEFQPHVLLHGPPGTGKSYTGKTFSLPTGGMASLTLTPDTPAAELRGHYIMGETGSFQWHDGQVTAAWRQGARCVLDEIGDAMGDAATMLHAFLDDVETAGETLPSGERILPHVDFRGYATTNVDPAMMGLALTDRFAVVEITEPHPAAIMALPEDLREFAWHSGTNTDLSRRLSLRTFKRFANARENLPGDMALRLAFGGRDDEVRDALSVAGVTGVSGEGIDPSTPSTFGPDPTVPPITSAS